MMLLLLWAIGWSTPQFATTNYNTTLFHYRKIPAVVVVMVVVGIVVVMVVVVIHPR